MKSTSVLACSLLASLAVAVPFSNGTDSSKCRCFPGDACWPSAATWSALNTTVNGRLLATVPIGSPCHDPTYDAAACDAVKAAWLLPETHFENPSSIMAPYFANNSCDPFTAELLPCQLGNYASYSIDVTNVDDIVAGIKFANTNNIRLVVKNTGHDFLGRSTGAGALSLWTHHLDSIEFGEFSDEFYTGPSATVGAGVLGSAILEAAAAEGRIVVGGTCPTVGLAGGYTQGGGHSALSNQFGLAADQTLAMTVVTAAGEILTVSRTENTDLYWALSGGGAGNYGVVVSMTIKTYPDAPVAGAKLTILAAYTSKDLFYKAISEYYRLLPAIVDTGALPVNLFSKSYFLINSLTAYNQTVADVTTTLTPFMDVLNALGVPFSVSYTMDDSYRGHYNNYMGPLPNGHVPAESYQFGSRLLPRATLEAKNADFQVVMRNLAESGVTIVGVSLDVSAPVKSGGVENAVLPAWRDAISHTYLTTPWNTSASFEANVEWATKMTNDFIPQLAAVLPADAGAYINEGDFQEPNYKQVYFGANWDKLMTVKTKYDPNSLFYGIKGVNSDVWTVSESGRMCRA